MNYRTPPSQHHAWPPMFGIFCSSKIERIVQFDASAKYELPDPADNNDVNKLFGFGFLPGHHTDSARFGWNYNKETNRVRLFAYCYVNGDRIIKFLCEVPLHQKVLVELDDYYKADQRRYCFTVSDAKNQWHVLGGLDIHYEHNRRFRYRLGCYFGGNNPAPHEINIKISRK